MKEVNDRIIETEKEVEDIRSQRDAKLNKIGNVISSTCIIDNDEV